MAIVLAGTFKLYPEILNMISNKIVIDRFYSPLGEILLGDYQGRLCLCDWALSTHRIMVDRRIRQRLDAEIEKGRTELTIKAAVQLDGYFSQQRINFDLPLLFCGTFFQSEVWRYLMMVPYGTTKSYGDLSRDVRRPKAVRAVANAVGANALAIIVPCHRIVGVSGALGGYSGGTLVKRSLLLMEKQRSLCGYGH